MITNRRPHKAHEGQVLILVAVGSIVLFAFAALAVDAGLALSERRGAQNAADAAALAAARAMVDGEGDHELRQTAQRYAQQNGYDIANPATDVTIDEVSVEVDVHWEVPRVFLGVFYDGDWSVSANAIASLDTVPADYGLIALSEDGDAINATGNTHIRVNGGGMMSNSGVSCAGSSTIVAESAVHAAGDILDTSQLSVACTIEGEQGGESSNRPVFEDPLAGTPTPDDPFPPPSLPAGSCEPEDERHNSVTVCQPGHYTSWPAEAESGHGLRLMPGTYFFDGANVTTNPYNTNEIEVVSGGTYNFYVRNANFNVNNASLDMGSNQVNMYFLNSSLNLTGSTDVVTLGSGVYYFDNSEFNIASGAGAQGDGVSFFFRNGGAFRSTGSTDVADFTAPSTSRYGEPPHMLIHVEPGSNTGLEFGASSRAYLDGVVYAPTSEFTTSGNVDGTFAHGQLIVGSFTVSGSLGTAANPALVEFNEYVEMGTPGVWLIQ